MISFFGLRGGIRLGFLCCLAVFVQAFFQKENFVNQEFDKIVKNYQSIKKSVAKVSDLPTVLLNVPWKGTWYTAGGQSYFAKLIADAGGKYLWADHETKNSFPVTIEEVFQFDN